MPMMPMFFSRASGRTSERKLLCDGSAGLTGINTVSKLNRSMHVLMIDGS